MRYNRQLPSPQELKREYPLSAKLHLGKSQRDEEIRAVFFAAKKRKNGTLE